MERSILLLPGISLWIRRALTGRPFDCQSSSTASRTHGVARRSVGPGREPTSTERHLVAHKDRVFENSRVSRLAHSSSHRPTLVFHDPLCLKNAGRSTPNGSAFHPTGSTGLSRVTGIRTLELLPCMGPGPGPGLSNRVQRFLSTRSRVLWESRPVRFCPVPGLRRWLHANGWVGNQRSTASNDGVSSGPPAGVCALVSSSGGKTVLDC